MILVLTGTWGSWFTLTMEETPEPGPTRYLRWFGQ